MHTASIAGVALTVACHNVNVQQSVSAASVTRRNVNGWGLLLMLLPKAGVLYAAISTVSSYI